MKKFMLKYSGMLAAFALVITTVTANSACNFDRTDISSPFSFTKTASNNTKMTAQTSGEIYASYGQTSGVHTVTLYRTGYSTANGTGAVNLISN